MAETPLIMETPHGHRPTDGRMSFLRRLDRMSSEERLRAAREEFDRHQLALWAARYPEEAPLVNGEYEWIALRLP